MQIRFSHSGFMADLAPTGALTEQAVPMFRSPREIRLLFYVKPPNSTFQSPNVLRGGSHHDFRECRPGVLTALHSPGVILGLCLTVLVREL